ncbi:hypothetical protein [Lysinibacillus sp. FSL W8-0992]|uniref:hypothetical protein n=1 Tax=Lysinibacillus sp. FSL W8-0992 TaxID=2954643 RepID=UPI0030F6B645
MNKRQERKVFVSLVTKIVGSNLGLQVVKATRPEKQVLRKHTEAVYSAVKLVQEEME